MRTSMPGWAWRKRASRGTSQIEAKETVVVTVSTCPRVVSRSLCVAARSSASAAATGR